MVFHWSLYYYYYYYYYSGHCWRSRDELISDVLLWTPTYGRQQKLDDQLEHTYSSSVTIRDVALKTCQRRWTIGRSGERVSGISMLAARHYYYHYYYYWCCFCCFCCSQISVVTWNHVSSCILFVLNLNNWNYIIKHNLLASK